MDNLHAASIIAVSALVTLILRFLPFWIFHEDRTIPPVVQQLSHALPHAVMGMLVVYCLKGVSFSVAPFGIPEILGCILVALLHIWKRNTLLSIGVGTVFYMAMVQSLF